eukprot:CAMPEP_0183299702 /NCGR_PEP_ID=MMETSP0160_2-20130417/6366_1 /TAXON_ID=2839 ORGANISM="Odontella Sinensis, Strain Grunow 1884" /NCGR_SAMPLE_ID=MMETSP0160_2 /ASSEMBLY_ACC=CAM_ASM_000250 /LENGTH=40 /DNA_ID= /DNA_START= /DNA_END= /DNA_ORIENTATION=
MADTFDQDNGDFSAIMRDDDIGDIRAAGGSNGLPEAMPDD